ncbi:CehA/McbA family metallohydrolase [Hufsiella ginkgonis]|uniref:Uncharacterized protein n=1 Tax=Hufsiella ginkgonis TaxID=2695274 RepID=A0A7K1XS02_9SPHI|nr:CehA/McbA family metallohydrolase [Hufsiella ginkgonis]MXV13765.1 hypothetical protein [Hufsiella ginkgonis]
MRSLFKHALSLSVMLVATAVHAQKLPVYHIYSGSTHAHTSYTESHGSQMTQIAGAKKYQEVDSMGVQRAINTTINPDWRKVQGPPSEHFALAKAKGYDFYIVTDHSQEAGFAPPSPGNPQWISTHEQAMKATDKNFVAIVGYEHSENDGPGPKGHLNVINSRSYLNALFPGIDIKSLYKWVDTVSSYGPGPVVATFNHPAADAWDKWAYRDEKVTDVFTMLEVINSNANIHYEAFVNALDAGWKVSPVCGNDNHGTAGISQQTSRTFVLATEKTQKAILEAMAARRTYASLEQNIQCRYTVNGAMMGATLKGGDTFKFDISISDPDTNKPQDWITKIEIMKDNGTVADTYVPSSPSHAVVWKPTVKNASAKYFFIRVWNAGGGDVVNGKAPADPQKPVAWLAPVWIDRGTY